MFLGRGNGVWDVMTRKVERTYLGEGVTKDGLEVVLDLVDANALLEVADDASDACDERVLLLGWEGVSHVSLIRVEGEFIIRVAAPKAVPARATVRNEKTEKCILSVCGCGEGWVVRASVVLLIRESGQKKTTLFELSCRGYSKNG